MRQTGTLQLLTKLRAAMPDLQALLVPSEDAHHSEYIAPCDCRRAFISGFTGSAGSAVVTHSAAALWTDGRYHVQAQQQMDSNWTLMAHGLPNVPTQTDWLLDQLPADARIGFDPWLMPFLSWEALDRRLRLANRRLVPLEHNLIDSIWTDRPARPNNAPLRILSDEVTGQSWPEKVKQVRAAMLKNKCQALVVSALDEIAWLFNLRGCDISHNPVFYAYAVVTDQEVSLFLDQEKISGTPGLRDHLTTVCLHDYSTIRQHLAGLLTTAPHIQQVWFDVYSSFALFSLVPEQRRLLEQSPIARLKAVKNHAELEGMKRAHLQDAVALCDYLSWLEETLVVKGDTTFTEFTAGQVLDGMRAEMEDFVSLSFDTISALGPNAAIIHYKPSQEDALPMTTSQLYLVDSGAQFVTGTTDVTRTVHMGRPTREEQEAFTLVLQGHINLSMTVFPSDVTGSRLDAIARVPLWRYGLEYKHGTGHGVGAFLNVHEGPCGFSGARSVASLEAGLQAGMVITIEPGYYCTGSFGVRIENVTVVVPAKKGQQLVLTNQKEAEKPFLTFEAITLTPLQAKMMVVEMLTDEEVAWINDYHKTCLDIVGPELLKRKRTRAYDWLIRETKTISK